jgi:hypothetical protein
MLDQDITQIRVEVDVLEDHTMDVEMNAQGAHQMISDIKDDLWDLNDLAANLNNQVERIQVEDISWCHTHTNKLEQPNNPVNCSLWNLVNHLSSRVEDQDDLIAELRAGLLQGKNQLGVLEMSSLMIHSRVQVLEEAMEIDPPVTNLSEGELEYEDMDDGGVMLVEDSEDERDQENVAPILIPAPHFVTPFPSVAFQSLILIEDLAPWFATPVPSVEDNAEGEDNAWYIPLIYHHQAHPLYEYSSAHVDPVPNYVEDVREDPTAGPHRDDLPADGSDDEMWVVLGVLA